MKTVGALFTVAAAMILLAVPAAEAAGRIRGGGVVANPEGGYSGGRAAAARGPNGATGARAGATSRSADGTLTHQSGMTASGAKGSVESSGGFTKTQDGVTQSRTTTATGTNGGTYQGSTSYDKNTGLTHSGSCTDASGNSVPCR